MRNKNGQPYTWVKAENEAWFYSKVTVSSNAPLSQYRRKMHYLVLKSHYLRASDSLNYGLEIEKIDFLEILPIFNFCQEMNKNAHFSQFFTSVSMATTIFYF